MEIKDEGGGQNMEEKKWPHACMICGQEKEEGLEILGKQICCTCEEEMVQSKVEDPVYLYYVWRLRGLFAN
ncbi:sigma factor G inhibitor Gin [Laceyella putida]|uniref:Sigma factor G inhibitor Gin n=1 Tax=Laceyella putida TaxID=110101 RepID=A0ABW2RRK5_9BACL